MKQILLFIILIYSNAVIAQTIRGNITSVNAEPLSDISITLENSDYDTR